MDSRRGRVPHPRSSHTSSPGMTPVSSSGLANETEPGSESSPMSSVNPSPSPGRRVHRRLVSVPSSDRSETPTSHSKVRARRVTNSTPPQSSTSSPASRVHRRRVITPSPSPNPTSSSTSVTRTVINTTSM